MFYNSGKVPCIIVFTRVDSITCRNQFPISWSLTVALWTMRRLYHSDQPTVSGAQISQKVVSKKTIWNYVNRKPCYGKTWQESWFGSVLLGRPGRKKKLDFWWHFPYRGGGQSLGHMSPKMCYALSIIGLSPPPKKTAGAIVRNDASNTHLCSVYFPQALFFVQIRSLPITIGHQQIKKFPI